MSIAGASIQTGQMVLRLDRRLVERLAAACRDGEAPTPSALVRQVLADHFAEPDLAHVNPRGRPWPRSTG